MAIHRVYIEADSEPVSYKKLFRKALMTGGAVVQLSEELKPEDIPPLIERFEENSIANGVQELVVKKLKEKEAYFRHKAA